MIGKYLATLHQHEAADYMELSSLTGVLPGMPRMAVIHDGTSAAGINWRARHLPANKRYYRDRLVALLVRDPRDTVVSYYFYLRRRQKGCPADLGSFLRDERYGIQKIVRFLNIWAANRAVPRGFLLVRYEDLHAEPVEQLSRYLSFAGVQWNEQAARRAVEYASFDNMRKMELGRQQNDRLTPADHADLTTFKTRRGVVGGYKDHLAGADLDYANDCMRLLDPVFGY